MHTRPAREAQRDLRRDDAGLIDALTAAGDRRARARDRARRARASTSAAAPTSWLATRERRRADRAPAASSAASRPRPTGSSRCSATVQTPVVCAVRGWAAGHRLPARARGRLHDRRRGRRDVLGAVRRARLHARQRRDVVVAAPGRRGARPRAVAARPEAHAATEAAEWGAIHRAVPAAELDGAVDELVDALAHGPDGRPRPDEVAAAPGRARVARAAARRTRRSRSSCRRAPTTSAKGSPRSRSAVRRTSSGR